MSFQKVLSRDSTRKTIGFVVLGVLAIFCLARASYGFDWSDEAYYAALSYRFVLGDVMFFDSWDLHQTSALFSVPLISLYTVVNGGSTEGIILFLRYCFVFVQFFLALAYYMVLRKRMAGGYALLIAGLILVFCPFLIPAFSYNTLALLFCLLAVLLLVAAEEKRHHRYLLYFFSGVFFSFSVQAYPTFLISLPGFVLMAVMTRKKGERLRKDSIKLYGLWACGALLVLSVFIVMVVCSTPMTDLSSNLSYTVSSEAHPEQTLAMHVDDIWKVTSGIMGNKGIVVYFIILLGAVLLSPLSSKLTSERIFEVGKVVLIVAMSLFAIVLTATIINTYSSQPAVMSRPDFTGGSKFEKMEPLWKTKKGSVTPKKSATKRSGWSMSTKANTLRNGLASSRSQTSSA